MAQITLLAPQTGAQTGKLAIAAHSADIAISADVLASAEECDIYVMAGNTWTIAVDAFGAAAKLTATKPMAILRGGPTYGVTKDATAGACGVYCDFLSR